MWGRASSTRGTYRSALYRLAVAASGRPGCRPTPFPGARAPAPYLTAERAELAALAAAQRGAARRSSALALVVFGIGAGLRPGELVALRGDDVTQHGRQVVVHAGGPAARLVPVTPDYAGHARELARRAGSGFVFRPGPADRGCKNFASNFTRGLTADPAAPRLSLRRVRSSFICHHLAAGTPVPVLLAVTGMAEAGSLARYARHLAGISSAKGSGKAPVIEAALAHRTGRPRPLPVRAVLTALLCLALDDRPLFLTAATRLLFCQLSDASRRLLGVPGTAIATMARPPGAPPAHPDLAIGLALARPGEDPGGTGARVLASVAARRHKAGWLGYGRAYTAAVPERFQLPARALGYRPVMDYRIDQRGIQANTGGAILVEGTWYCPALPGPLINATTSLRDHAITRKLNDQQITARACYQLKRKDGRCWISAFPVRVASAVAHAAREVQGAGDRRVFPACAGCGRDPPKVAVTAVRAQRIRVAAVSGWSP